VSWIEVDCPSCEGMKMMVDEGRPNYGLICVTCGAIWSFFMNAPGKWGCEMSLTVTPAMQLSIHCTCTSTPVWTQNLGFGARYDMRQVLRRMRIHQLGAKCSLAPQPSRFPMRTLSSDAVMFL